MTAIDQPPTERISTMTTTTLTTWARLTNYSPSPDYDIDCLVGGLGMSPARVYAIKSRYREAVDDVMARHGVALCGDEVYIDADDERDWDDLEDSIRQGVKDIDMDPILSATEKLDPS